MQICSNLTNGMWIQVGIRHYGSGKGYYEMSENKRQNKGSQMHFFCFNNFNLDAQMSCFYFQVVKKVHVGCTFLKLQNLFCGI